MTYFLIGYGIISVFFGCIFFSSFLDDKHITDDGGAGLLVLLFLCLIFGFAWPIYFPLMLATFLCWIAGILLKIAGLLVVPYDALIKVPLRFSKKIQFGIQQNVET